VAPSTYLIKSRPWAEGATRIAAPQAGVLHYLEFTVLSLSAGRSHSLPSDAQESVLYLIAGQGEVAAPPERKSFVLGPRSDVFTDPPWAVYLPPHRAASITAVGHSLLAVLVRVPSVSRAPATLVSPKELERRTVGAGNWERTVYNVVDAARGAGRLMVGETINRPGSWSSYPPHKHDVRSAAGELPMEEVYFYRVRPVGGFGLQMLYTAPGHPQPIDEVYRVGDGDLLVIPRGYHPVVAAAGYDLYYLWAMAGEESRYGAWSDDPAHAWVRGLERELLKDKG
jgi:5-deoxy-glucuronate isomerase